MLEDETETRICLAGPKLVLYCLLMQTSTALEPKPTGRRAGRTKKPMLVRQYTKMVVTPSHRAPEVVMSQGQYTSAIDM
jgi:serine/threonine protein kinase